MLVNPPSTASVTSVVSSASTVTLCAANTSRRQLSIYNASTQVLYLKYGTGASSADYSLQVAAGGLYELPASSAQYISGYVVADIYTGVITGAWASANGTAKVTEIS